MTAINKIPVDEAISLYKKLWTLRALADKYETYPRVIRNLLTANGVTIRSLKEAANILNRKNVKAYSHEDEICEKYNRGATKNKLGNEYSCSPNTIIKILKQNGIRIRGKSEAGKLSYKQKLSGELEETKEFHKDICSLYNETKSIADLERAFKHIHRELLIQILRYNKIRIYTSFSKDFKNKKSYIKKEYNTGRSIRSLAQEFNVAVMTMYRYFQIHNIETRGKGRGVAFRIRYKDHAEKIRKDYQSNKETNLSLAKKYNVSITTIVNYLSYFNIKKVDK